MIPSRRAHRSKATGPATRFRSSARHILAESAAAVLLGAASGLAASFVRLSFRGLQWCLTHNGGSPADAAAALPPWRRLLTPIVGALVATLILALRRRHAHRLGREPRPFVEYVEAVRHQHGRIPLVPNLWRTASAAFSVASGAAVGREGSMIQFAAAVTSWLQQRARRWRFAEILPAPALAVACGVAAGVTTAYAAPIAGVFFAAEIVLGELRLRELLPLALASAAGWGVSRALLGPGPLYPTQTHLHLATAGWTLWLLPLFALVIGALGPLYQRLLRSLSAVGKLPLALALAGVLVGALSLLDPRVWGNGDLGLSAALGHNAALGHATTVPLIPALTAGAASLAILLLLRLLATTLCVGAGTVGGVFTPTLFAGGAFGALAAALFAHLFRAPADPALWAIAGMGALIAAATHAPLMATFMAVELTGDWRLLPMLLLLNLLAWLLARQLSAEALYAIASQTPVHRGLPPPHRRP
jgi:CIC family chloride channel protein